MLLSANPAKARAEPGAHEVHAVMQSPVLRWDLLHNLAALSGGARGPDAPPPAPGPLQGRAMRILSAEDNRTNQLVFAKMLRDLDIELRFADNGREALEIARAWEPDLVFMDVSMPEMDGREATRRIRAAEAGSGRHVPIVALTAHAMEGDEASILDAGMDRYLTKPLRKAAITGAILAFCPQDARLPTRAPG
jgi:hypothetical protein